MSNDDMWEAAAEDLKGRPRKELHNMKKDDRTGLVEKELKRRKDAGERG